MASWLSAAVFSLCLSAGAPGAALGTQPASPERRVEREDVRSLAQLCPEPGDRVVLDVDDTLIMPVHSMMASEREEARSFWRPILQNRFESTMARAWCGDRRRLAEPALASLLEGWRSGGVEIMALTSRFYETPQGTPMDEALVRQLKELGIPMKISPTRRDGQLFEGELLCTHGSSKVPFCLDVAERVARQGVSAVWVVDDRLDTRWESQQLPAVCAPLRVVHVHRSPTAVVSPLLEQLEFGYWLKTGRWPHSRAPDSVRGIGLSARGKGEWQGSIRGVASSKTAS